MMSQRKGPCIYLSGFPRTTPRSVWKYVYRLYRVHQRELEKAQIDMLLYGSSFMCYPDDGDPKHIPLDQVILPDVP